MSINKDQAIAVVNGDASEFLISDFKNKNAVISLVSIIVIFVGPPVLIKLTGISALLYLWWLIPIAVIYGIYLMFSNTAVFYASKKDLINILGLFGLPFLAALVGSFINDTIGISLFGLSILGSLYLFGLKSANANALLNSELHIIQQISLMFAKVLIVPLFVAALLAQFERIESGTKQRKNASSVEELEQGRDKQIAGAIGIAVLTFIGGWFYKNSINSRKVFEKRGFAFDTNK